SISAINMSVAGRVMSECRRATSRQHWSIHHVESKEPIMKITRAGTTPSAKGPADWFTGTVRVDPMFNQADPDRVQGAHVTFEPGARTAWHTHPLGQTLIVTFGRGLVQRWDGAVEEIHPGDVVWFEPG